MIAPLVAFFMTAPLAVPAALSATQPSGATPPAGPRLESALAGEVSTDRGLATVRELVACGVRLGGSPSNRCAAERIETALRTAGLAVERIEDPPRAWYDAASWSLEVEGAPLASAWPVIGSPARAKRTLPLVLDEADRGAWRDAAVVSRRAPGDLLKEAAEAGAGALLSWHPADPAQFVDWAPSENRFRARAGAIPLPAFGLSYREGMALDGRLRGPGSAPRLSLALESSAGNGPPLTVVGRLPGAGSRAGESFLVCAHGDSDGGGPGADDNASGVAAVIEVARALAAGSSRGWLPADRPAILFAVWGSEIHSSRSWAMTHPEELKRLRAVFNYDQAGFGAELEAIYYEGNDVPWNADLLRTLEAVAGDHAGEAGFSRRYTSNPSMGGTDMYVFLPRKYQGMGITELEIPATTVFVSAWGEAHRMKQTPGWISPGWPEGEDLVLDYSTYYHSAGDTPANTTQREPENVARCAKLVVAGIARLMERGAGKPPAGEAAPDRR